MSGGLPRFDGRHSDGARVIRDPLGGLRDVILVLRLRGDARDAQNLAQGTDRAVVRRAKVFIDLLHPAVRTLSDLRYRATETRRPAHAHAGAQALDPARSGTYIHRPRTNANEPSPFDHPARPERDPARHRDDGRPDDALD